MCIVQLDCDFIDKWIHIFEVFFICFYDCTFELLGCKRSLEDVAKLSKRLYRNWRYWIVQD